MPWWLLFGSGNIFDGQDPEMPKHRGFPLGLPGTQWQYTLRRANSKVTKLTAMPRHRTMDQTVALADAGFLQALWQFFGPEPFERGNLDGERLGASVRAGSDCRRARLLIRSPILPCSRSMSRLREKSFPGAFEGVVEG